MITEKLIKKYSQYIGNTFGMIRVDDIDLSTENRIYFKCTCLKCGRKLRIRNDGLHKNRVGCSKCLGKWRKEHFLEKNKDLLPKDIRNKYIHFKCNAKRKNKNIQFDLTKEQVEDMCKKPCYYCNKPRCLGVDRVDNSKGYTMDNCVPCCGICNRMKMDLDPIYFLQKINDIYKHIIESSTTIPKGSTSQANGDGNGEHLTEMKIWSDLHSDMQLQQNVA